VSEARLEKALPPQDTEEDSCELAEYLMGEEGGEWLWLLAPILSG